jgi:hypothetical protein
MSLGCVHDIEGEEVLISCVHYKIIEHRYLFFQHYIASSAFPIQTFRCIHCSLSCTKKDQTTIAPITLSLSRVGSLLAADKRRVSTKKQQNLPKLANANSKGKATEECTSQ